jgi:hypothetical protein
LCRPATLQLNNTAIKGTKNSVAKTKAMGICTKSKQKNYKLKNNTATGEYEKYTN